MRFWLLMFNVLYGLMRGLHEGMAMHFPNVREYYAYYTYHIVVLLEPLCLIAATVAWCASCPKKIFVAGTLVLMWEVFELSYIITRSGQVSWSHENVLGFYTVDNLLIVIGIHIVRVLTGVACIYWSERKK